MFIGEKDSNHKPPFKAYAILLKNFAFATLVVWAISRLEFVGILAFVAIDLLIVYTTYLLLTRQAYFQYLSRQKKENLKTVSDKKMSKQNDLRQLANDIVIDNVCPELRDGASQLVFADGNPEADIVFIGEAPGKKEDETGLPFVGAAGKFLGTLLEAIGLNREEVYITNIVKYRPPDNRDPLPEEKKAFWPYLVRQIEVIKPKLVVTLGRHSMEYFLPNQKIGVVHGEPKLIELGNRKQLIMPLFHPAAALYNGSLRQTLLDNFSKIPTLLSKMKTSSEDMK